ncbi:MAG TPA: LysM domain-containing protein [Planctomycetota bacterium]|nr:LysM domain-containing protein [Planctomycetota bacterium]
MQRIERYGVIALVFLLVTIVAVSLWGERKQSDGWFSFLDRESKSARIEELLAEASTDPAPGSEPVTTRGLGDERVPLSPPGWGPTGGSAHRGPGEPPAVLDEFGVRERDSSIAPESLSDVVYMQPTHDSDPVVTQAQVAPPSARAREYTIRSGDTLSEIAMRELGTKERWRELVALNPGIDPLRLREGDKIRLGGVAAAAPASGGLTPAVAKVVETPRPVAGGGSYTIRSGDTLSQIAMRELGTKDRWRELVALNPGLDPARLLVGTKIRLPGGTAAIPPAQPRETRVARAEPPAPAKTQGGSKVR